MKLTNFVICFLIVLNITVLLEGGGSKDKGKKLVSTSGVEQGHEEQGNMNPIFEYLKEGAKHRQSAIVKDSLTGFTRTVNERPEYHPIQDFHIMGTDELETMYSGKKGKKGSIVNIMYDLRKVKQRTGNYILLFRVKTSSTWNHFTQIGNGKVACNECGLEMSENLSNLKTHRKTCWKINKTATDNFTSVGNDKVKCNACKHVMSSKYLKNLLDHVEASCKEGEASNVEGGDNEDIDSEDTV
uniref:BED-type domain-containing protein n=1 Tax=Meloidogyne javanica TaxID=6303 RepID=A0A915LFJ0_MELJA